MSYLKDIKYFLKDINELCDDAIKEDDDYKFYIQQIKTNTENALGSFESLIYELELGEEKLAEASKIIKEYLYGND